MLQAVDAEHRCIYAGVGPPGVTRVIMILAYGANAMDVPGLVQSVRTFDAWLTSVGPIKGPASGQQAHGTVPIPVGAVQRLSMRMAMVNGLPMPNWTNKIWFLFPGGIATDCAQADPASLVFSLATLRARENCTGARWRRLGGHIELQLVDGDAWTHDRVFELPPAPKNFHLDFDGTTVGGSGSGSDIGGMGATHVLTGGEFHLTRAGRIEASLSSSVSFNSDAAFAAASRRTPGLRGQYVIDGYVLRVRTDDGTSVVRYVVFDKGKWDRYHYAYYEGTQYWIADGS